MRPEDMTAPAEPPRESRTAPSRSDRTALQPGDEIELAAADVAHGGWCVARLDGSGPVVFVRHTLPGERVRARITEVTSKFARADAVEILAVRARPGRAAVSLRPPRWLRRLRLAARVACPPSVTLKAAVVRQQLRRIADIEWPVTVEPLPGDAPGDPDPGLGWRTRVTFAVRSDGVAGLRAHRSHRVVEIDDCLIAHPRVRDLGVPGRRWPRARSVEAATGTGGPERAVIVAGGRPAAATAGLPAEVGARAVPWPHHRGPWPPLPDPARGRA